MTLEEIKVYRHEILTAAEVSDVLKCDPYKLIWQAKNDPQRLGFPVIVIGNRVKIPRRKFLDFMGVKE